MALPSTTQEILREHGLIAENYVGPDSYFAMVSKILGSDAREKISELQSQPEFNLFFCAFEPDFFCRPQETLYNPNKIRQACLNRSKKHRTGPCRRDIYATAELLQRAIHMFHITADALDLDVFLPTFCNLTHGNEREIKMLMLLEREEIRFYRLKRVESQENGTTSANRNQCDCNKFHSKLTEPSVQLYARGFVLDQLVENHWAFHQPSTSRDFSFYRCLSQAIYGDEKWFPLIRNLIVEFEQQEDFLPIFQTFITQTGRNQSGDMTTQTRNHFSQQINGSRHPGTGEIYAASSLFCTEIFIWSENRKEWNVYHPLLLPTKARQHFVTLAKLDEEFELLVPAVVSCNCQLKRPPVRTIKDQRSELEKAAWDLTAFKPCCQDRRHGPHTHLQFLASGAHQHFSGSGIRHTGSRLSTDAEHVSVLLKVKERRLDINHTIGGTFQQCILKEIYGTDDVNETAQFPVSVGTPNDEDIMRTANWLKRPIYIFTKDGLHTEHKWEAFLPEQVSSHQCRYYVTLYKNPDTQLYDRVVPIRGCNCSVPPPIEILRDESYREHISRSEIKRNKRHNPMLEYFLENITEDMITNENIYPPEDLNPPVSSVLSDIYHALQRYDMADRIVDTIEGSNSLFACLSKEIFGNSEKDNIIASLILTELCENETTYAVLYSGAANAKVQTESLASLQGFGEIDLLAAATFLQTRILVLLVEPDGTSRWKEFTQMRRKPRPQQMPRLQSVCLREGTADKYCITLLRNAYGEFYRILPKDRICNCQMEQIGVPGRKEGSLRDDFTAPELDEFATGIPDIWSQTKRKAFLTFRTLDSALGKVYCDINNLYKILEVQLVLHETIIRKVESRRRDANITTVTGSMVSAVGTAIMIGGATFAGPTGGRTLAVAGVAVSLLGVGSVAGSTLIEGALSSKDLEHIIKINELLEVIAESTVASVRNLNKRIRTVFDEQLGGESELLGHVGDYNFDILGNLQIIPTLCMLEEMCHAVSTLLSRLAVKTSSVILGKLLAGFSMIFDGIMIAMAVRSLKTGSKTKTSERLRKNQYQLRAVKSILKTYIQKAE
ncbi:uncharacterized protein LOC117335981 [Pecten maximus]|uniref:uncharacterized protein LOC117335981 n=1 Tax=Pecten maximus TaxID=6579 RepID=UPI001458CF04|nr:uncharacterized protein LOC117335981 [Pecten maximus]